MMMTHQGDSSCEPLQAPSPQWPSPRLVCLNFRFEKPKGWDGESQSESLRDKASQITGLIEEGKEVPSAHVQQTEMTKK